MTPRPGRRSPGSGSLALAGWLFAELAMVLAIVAMSSEAMSPPRVSAQPGHDAPSSSVTSTTAAPTSSPSGTHATPPRPAASRTTPAAPSWQRGLSTRVRSFVMPVPGSTAALRNAFVLRLRACVGPSAVIGLVQLFARSRGGGDPITGGIALATRVGSVVRRTPSTGFLPGTSIRPFFSGDGIARGSVRVELFVLVQR